MIFALIVLGAVAFCAGFVAGIYIPDEGLDLDKYPEDTLEDIN